MTFLLKSEPRIKVENILSVYAEYTHAEMASHERATKMEPRIYVLFVFELDNK